MIVPMKKVTLITMSSCTDATLDTLRTIGVVHVEKSVVESPSLSALYEKRKILHRAINIIASFKPKKKPAKQDIGSEHTLSYDEKFDIAKKIAHTADTIAKTYEEIDRLIKLKDSIADWGSFTPDQVVTLRNKGIEIRLFEIKKTEIDKIPSEINYLSAGASRYSVRLVVFGRVPEDFTLWHEFLLPESSLDEIVATIREKRRMIDSFQKELTGMNTFSGIVGDGLAVLEKQIEFEEVKQSMGDAETLSSLSGYIPIYKTGIMIEAAKKNGWGLVLSDPDENDRVPTLLKTSKAVGIIQPLFDFFDIRPGYREYDISFWFLLFFSVFFAMLVGDAAYGSLIIIFTTIARIKMKKAPMNVFLLFYLMGFFTLVWGAVTGNWFGLETLSRSPLLSWMVIPQLAAFPDPTSGINTRDIIIDICFTIGVIHLTIAHLISIKRLFPSLKMIAEFGKLSIVWAMYFLVEVILLKKPPFPYSTQMIAGGFILIFIFSEQEGNFLKGLLKSLAGLLPMALNVISVFADIISYFRIFVVGLAGVEIAKSFTKIALSVGFESILSGFFAALILVAVHALNILMSGLSVIVHGVRLNLLEFSGHMGLEWSGFAYRPFREE